ncbi:hypothetical protein GCM10027598_13260 [Amycolatopsis oliviviridis]|uniref:Uncharacterized protein n=1 Tax=Amycolatopsis oliviviridis TaxID=1471590 RepID=A0ABQ3LV82_9PSEU|nr:hypothetical protein GCM10017790_52880 [Amycolatopsis oliviviridis]
MRPGPRDEGARLRCSVWSPAPVPPMWHWGRSLLTGPSRHTPRVAFSGLNAIRRPGSRQSDFRGLNAIRRGGARAGRSDFSPLIAIRATGSRLGG